MANTNKHATQEWVENNTLLLSGTKVDKPITGNVEFKTTTPEEGDGYYTDEIITVENNGSKLVEVGHSTYILDEDANKSGFLKLYGNMLSKNDSSLITNQFLSFDTYDGNTEAYYTDVFLDKQGLEVSPPYYKLDENGEQIFTDDDFLSHFRKNYIQLYYANFVSENYYKERVKFTLLSKNPLIEWECKYKSGDRYFYKLGELEEFDGVSGTPKYGITFENIGDKTKTNLIFEEPTTPESNVIIPSKNGTIALIEDLTPTKLIEILSSATTEEITQIKTLLA